MTNDRTHQLALGIDAGGTQTRWALADGDGVIVAEGSVAGLSATQMADPAGRVAVRLTFAALATAVLDVGQPARVCAGLTGFDVASRSGLISGANAGSSSGASSDGATLAAWLADALAIPAAAVALRSDIEIAYLDSFAPGEGYLVYAGTGSIAAWIDADGVFHRAGGRGVLLDDGGGGYWIAREALRHIWRAEDEAPGAWRESAMARAVFAHIGGADWSLSRDFMYGQQRGAIGRLALAVAASADDDAQALLILRQAGAELARLARALAARHGARPVALAGRAATLHPAIVQAMRAALPAALRLRQAESQPHRAAARIALHSALDPRRDPP
ncbi:BadF/BadG/BcrA/BcrD ATPase family protein [Rugamonas sp.]|uniref:BadF/BadG/BcrA/BcrD ATPase family protein n=1 Tax=Rugamonas sp. TaxID=1926287 RepID=UPI0025F87FD6|nr:BadF/BadG/BcrA/BcrD ATPase family protein [Rugamonas sp.]